MKKAEYKYAKLQLDNNILLTSSSELDSGTNFQTTWGVGLQRVNETAKRHCRSAGSVDDKENSSGNAKSVSRVLQDRW